MNFTNCYARFITTKYVMATLYMPIDTYMCILSIYICTHIHSHTHVCIVHQIATPLCPVRMSCPGITTLWPLSTAASKQSVTFVGSWYVRTYVPKSLYQLSFRNDGSPGFSLYGAAVVSNWVVWPDLWKQIWGRQL